MQMTICLTKNMMKLRRTMTVKLHEPSSFGLSPKSSMSCTMFHSCVAGSSSSSHCNLENIVPSHTSARVGSRRASAQL